jgi:hypothetical protein
MEELSKHLKLHPNEPLPKTLKDIRRECVAIKPYPEMLGVEDSNWREEIISAHF